MSKATHWPLPLASDARVALQQNLPGKNGKNSTKFVTALMTEQYCNNTDIIGVSVTFFSPLPPPQKKKFQFQKLKIAFPTISGGYVVDQLPLIYSYVIILIAKPLLCTTQFVRYTMIAFHESSLGFRGHLITNFPNVPSYNVSSGGLSSERNRERPVRKLGLRSKCWSTFIPHVVRSTSTFLSFDQFINKRIKYYI